MRIKHLNNLEKRRAFSHGIWFSAGEMFPYKSSFFQIMIFGHLFMIEYGKRY